MPPLVGVIDYRMGNLKSVANAFAHIGADVRIIKDPEQLVDVEKIVLPGVGAFGDGIANLRALGFLPFMEREVFQRSKPFMGICLGLQLLAKTGWEHGRNKGLGWIPGVVRILAPSDERLRVPHIGWNEVVFRPGERLFEGLGDRKDFYFVHSYHFVPEDPSVVTGECNYGESIVASIRKDNIAAVQYHPEKSHKSGIKVLENFVRGLTD
ncbi:MAG: imidazole glycerol phosphate synthase subunit HisH [Deltaproteobacteria bacterium]|nr:imidazole glycerol phosphate synthase subunit HisH [Deltaproteobacteria bacterium]MDH3382538.1 imidazole glycerol phosphate synthase subunit HisH [Deltaproteobacteria bacterium]